MHRIDTAGNVAGLFREFDPAAGPGTKISADWLNDLQESLCRLVENAGIPLTKGDYDQLWQAFDYYGVTAGLVGYATKAAMNADLSRADKVMAMVTNDPTAINNGIYRKNGAAGAGAWVRSDYDPLLQMIAKGELLLNKGADYPLRPMVRDGVTSVASAVWNNLLLKIRVVGGRPDEIYQLSYLQNEADIGGNADFGWYIKAFPRDTFATASAPITLRSHSDPAPEIDRDGGIQTLHLTTDRPELSVYVTLDASALPAAGTPVDSYTNNTKPAWSWVVDDACVEFAPTTTEAGAYWAKLGADISYSWRSGDRLYRLRCGPNGHNDLPNIIGLDSAPLGDLASAAWTVVEESSTDWLPPLTVMAAANGDGGGTIYTGGNHGADGGSGGAQTARNILYQLLVDNQPLAADGSGYAESVTILVQNEIMAYNTISFPRYVVRQSFMLTLRPGSVEVQTEVRALEGVTVKTDNGLQSITTGFQASQLFLGGQTAGRVAFDSTANSGARSGYPEAWAVVLHDAEGAQQVSWMDRTYEFGDGRNVAPASPLVRFGGVGNTKSYHAVISAQYLSLAAGETYRWRGGYAWQAPGLAPAGVDSTIVIHRAGAPCAVLVVSGNDYALLPDWRAGRKKIEILDNWSGNVSVSATTNEEALRTVKLPPLGPYDRLRITTGWEYTNSANDKTPRVRLGGLAGTTFWSKTETSTSRMHCLTHIRNAGDSNAQIAPPDGSTSGFGSWSGAAVTGAIDTSIPQDLVLSGQKEVAGETLTLKSTLVELIRG